MGPRGRCCVSPPNMHAPSPFRVASLLVALALAPFSAQAADQAPSAGMPPAVSTPLPSDAGTLPETCYLFSYFTRNGQDGLRLAWSRDGYLWEDVPGGPFLAPVLEDKIMRDPCIQQGPDGRFHMVWTTSWTKGGFGYASSEDLLHWSEQSYVPAMAQEPKVQNTWAPELSYDASSGEWLIIWSSTITGRFADTDPTIGEGPDKKILNHRLYATRTRDFRTFSPTALFYDDGFSVIDATLVPVGDRVAMVVKDERLSPEPRKDLRIAWARDLKSPFGTSAPSFTRSLIPGWLEGPTIVKIGAKWFLYADAYRDRHYVLLTSTDFASWKDETASLCYPKGLRHGTAFAVKREVLAGRK